VAASDDCARLYDVKSARLIGTLEAHLGFLGDGRFSPDGSHIITASDDATVKIWAVPAPKLRQRFAGHRQLARATLSPEGEHVLTSGSLDRFARVWDASTGKQIVSHRHQAARVYAARFLDKGRSAVTAPDNSDAVVWDTRSGRERFRLRGYAVVAAPDDSMLVTRDTSGVARVWDATNGKLIAKLAGHRKRIWGIDIDRAGKTIATGSRDKTIKIWDARTGRLRQTLTADHPVRAVAFAAGGRILVTRSGPDRVELWETRSGRRLHVLKGHLGAVVDSAVSDDGTYLVTCGADKTARVWDARNGTLVSVLRGHGEEVNRCTFDPSGARVATGGMDETAKIWDRQSGRLLMTLDGHGAFIRTIEFSRDGSRLLTGSVNGVARLWDVHLETRPPARIQGLVAQKSPWVLRDGRLVPRP
jgi:WD40 repeat protein